jgi:hypothetical protein
MVMSPKCTVLSFRGPWHVQHVVQECLVVEVVGVVVVMLATYV